MATPESRAAVRGLVFARAGVVAILAASVVAAHVAGRLAFPLVPVLLLLGLTYPLSAVYLGLLPRVRDPARFAEVQVYVDVALETVLIYLTGGPNSVFPVLYLVSILTASIVVAPGRSYGPATAAVLLHGALLGAEFFRWIPPIEGEPAARNIAMEGSLAILLISGNFSAAFVVAYLSTRLAGRLRQVRGEARRSEASLAALRVLHEDIVHSVASGLLTFDREGRVTSVNRTAEALCLRGEAELRQLGWDALFRDAPAFAEVWESLERGASPRPRFEAQLLRPGGAAIPIGMSLSSLRRGRGVICSFQDLTEIRRMEQRVRQADRLAAVGRMAAGLAHEIRNPIGAIRGSVEVLRESLAPRGADRRLMDIVLRESDRLDSTIRDFLQFSRPPRPVQVPTDLGAMVEEILLILGNDARMQGGGAAAVRIVGPAADPSVKAAVDPSQMRQALWNLCLNAVQAMPDGGELRVELRGPAPDRPTVEIVIADTGIGIPASELPHVFEPFYTTKASGTGLGLAIAHRIVEDHEGEIRVESEPGLGSRFAVVLPAGEA